MDYTFPALVFGGACKGCAGQFPVLLKNQLQADGVEVAATEAHTFITQGFMHILPLPLRFSSLFILLERPHFGNFRRDIPGAALPSRTPGKQPCTPLQSIKAGPPLDARE
ncbi:MAG: hypothetical protein BWY80_01340 [Firmicutes bacterium ADurb.Bin456]|nr:MAG: hypothetical protein BWY80_01340 [Firmicutes bacterium ADurb.Bin456]